MDRLNVYTVDSQSRPSYVRICRDPAAANCDAPTGAPRRKNFQEVQFRYMTELSGTPTAVGLSTDRHRVGVTFRIRASVTRSYAIYGFCFRNHDDVNRPVLTRRRSAVRRVAT